MRLSRGFSELWQSERIDELLTGIALQPNLRNLVESSFIKDARGTFLEEFAQPNIPMASFPDRTGYEAFTNKFHIDDFITLPGTTASQNLSILFQQGIKAALRIAERLKREGKYRVILSLDVDVPTMTLRFFERRPGEPWGEEDPNAFQLEDVLIIDTSPSDGTSAG